MDLSPERTSGRAGFIHPYELTATVETAELRIILRDFEESGVNAHAELLERTAREVLRAEPRARYELDVRRQYGNMRRYLEPVPQVLAAAEEAIRAEGVEPIRRPIRGGTDGSLLSEMGLPTPNIFTGGHEYHSVREWASLQEMAAAAATIVHLAEIWARPQ
jgi:tripeptide aminopeptidase